MGKAVFEFIQKNKVLDAVALVWLITQLSKFYTYLFEVGYLHRFGIPYQSVHVGIESFVTFGLTLVFTLLAILTAGAGGIFLQLYTLHKATLHDKLGPMARYGSLSILVSGAFIPLLAYYREVSLVNFLHVLLIVTPPLVFCGFIAWLVVRLYPELRGFVRMGRLAALGLVFAFAGVGWALYLGQWFASTESTFRQVGGNQIIVREYNDMFMTAEIHDHKLTGTYHYVPVDRIDSFEVVSLENLSR